MYDYVYDSGDLGNVVLNYWEIFIKVFRIILVIVLIIGIIQLIAQYKMYKKTGKNGWEVFIPFYTNWVLVEIAELNWYWFLIFFAPTISGIINMPLVGYGIYYLGTFNIFYNISKKFNKGVGFAICLTLFTPICIMILGFSKKNVYDKSIPVSKDGIFGNQNSNNYQANNNINQKFCPNCGTYLPNNVNFCTNCGNKTN